MKSSFQGKRVDRLDSGDALPAVGSYWTDGNNHWSFVTPNGLYGGLTPGHHVEEHEDGTISVLPRPGNSNSILVNGSGSTDATRYHGYIRRGVWEECDD